MLAIYRHGDEADKTSILSRDTSWSLHAGDILRQLSHTTSSRTGHLDLTGVPRNGQWCRYSAKRTCPVRPVIQFETDGLHMTILGLRSRAARRSLGGPASAGSVALGAEYWHAGPILLDLAYVVGGGCFCG